MQVPNTIMRSVGQGCTNSPLEVKQVQELLNRAKKRLNEAGIPIENFGHLDEDKLCGPSTIKAIKIFQRDIVGLSRPDGKIDPGGKTIKMLYAVTSGNLGEIKVQIQRHKHAPGGAGGSAAVPKLTPSGDLTVEALAWLAPNLNRNKIPAKPQDVVDAMNLAMREAEANTPERKAAFLSQVIHESDGLNTTTEYASGDAYERDIINLGNTQPGDGRRFKGRGFIQLTGRANYTNAWLALGFSVKKDATTKHLVNGVDPIEPERAARLRESALTTAWFWKKNGLNALADALRTAKNEEAQVLAISIRVNGKHKNGLPNGWEERKKYYRKAKQLYK